MAGTTKIAAGGGGKVRKATAGGRVVPEALPPRADGREPPWAGLGTDVRGARKAEEAIVAAGLDWTTRVERIATVESRLPIGGGRCLAVVREDTNKVLGVVGRHHRTIDNRTCFDFMDAVSGKAGGVTYETAGHIGEGERVWLLARTEGLVRVMKDDVVQPYLLLHNAHDGSGRLRVLYTPIRVCCLNTLNAALARGQGEGFSIRHSGDVAGKVRLAQDVLGLARTHFDDLGGLFGRMAEHRLTGRQRAAYFRSVFRPRGDAEGRKWPAVADRLDALAEAGAGQADGTAPRGTLWAAYNAVTEYSDYYAPGHSAGKTEHQRRSTRLREAWFGARGRQKADALAAARVLLN